MEKKDMIERQCWREQLIGMQEGKEKDKIRRMLQESKEKAENDRKKNL